MFIFTGYENCEKKVVTPLEVALLQLQHIIIIPLSSFGSGIGKFTEELWSKLVLQAFFLSLIYFK